MNACKRSIFCATVFAVLLGLAAEGSCAASAQEDAWQRVTAHLNGVLSPRGYFNLLVGLYSLPTLKSAQFNLGSSSLVLDFPPGTPAVTVDEIQHIEKLAGYRPGPVTIEHISAQDFAETGAGWVKIKHTKAKNVFARWMRQNF